MFVLSTTMKTFRQILAIPISLLLALSFTVHPGLAADGGIPTLGVVQQWSLAAPDANTLDEFGYSVAIDGRTAVIGARNADPDLGGGPVANAGAAYVYHYNGKTWVFEAKLTARDAAPGDTFGVSVAISGGAILVGATGVDVETDDEDEEDGQWDDVGAAYVFTRSSGIWSQQVKLTAADWAQDDSFGSAVALDKNTAVVAANTKDLLKLVDVGAAYVFYNSGGKNWKQQAKLLPTDPWLGDYFGTSVAVSGDFVAAGATQFDPTDESGTGRVYLFRRSNSLWMPEALLAAKDGRSGDAFGGAVALYGRTLVVGAHHADPYLSDRRVASAGAAYVFSDAGEEWKEEAALMPPNGRAFDQFGQAVDVYGDTVVVGAEGTTQAGNSGAGAVYVFRKSQGEWSLQTRAVTSKSVENDSFGSAVALSRDWFVAGARGGDPGAKGRAGEAYLNLLGASAQLPETGFAPNRQTRLPPQPARLAYQEYGAMSLEIPALGASMEIAGVPRSGDGWDVRWLGKQAGYLEGTAFPTWPGNTGLAGHSLLADGSPGPFAGLPALVWGDRIIINAWGQRYLYEVRESHQVDPAALDVFAHEELDWITLVTCQGYDGTSYRYRWVVRAVLAAVVDQ